LKVSDPFEEFDQKQEIPDSLGLKHIKLQQFYKGISVWGKEMIVHLDKEDTVYLIEGRITPTPDTDISPRISKYEAMDVVIRDFEETPSFSDPELVIHVDGIGIKRLAYHIEVHLGYQQWQYFIDAKTGVVIEKYNDTKTESVPASGVDLFGQTRNFHAWQYNGTYYMIDTSLPVHTQDPSIPNEDFGAGNVVIIKSNNRNIPSNNPDDIKPDISYLDWVTSSYSNSGWDSTGISALYNLYLAENYFKNTFNRNSYDDKGSSIVGSIHVGDKWLNACWDGNNSKIFFGDETTMFKPFAKALDIISHEFTHAVTQYTANLKYETQSGALNEAFSDIFGCMVDRDDWLMGEDITKVSPGFLRSLINPHEGAEGQLSGLIHPATMDEYQILPNDGTGNHDNGGVHVNSTIPARTAYLVAEGLTQEGSGTSIGRNKTEQIYYRALSQHLTAESDFYQARLATIQSAE
jgi:bacillolysin